jgi:hypothetical protein
VFYSNTDNYSDDQGARTKYNIDSCSNEHVTPWENLLSSVTSSYRLVNTAAGYTHSKLSGTTVLRLRDIVSSVQLEVSVRGVIHLPKCSRNLLSLSKLQRSGIEVDFNNLRVILPNGRVVKLHTADGLYYIDTAPSTCLAATAAHTSQHESFEISDKQIAHVRFAHTSSRYLDELKN